MSTPRTAAVSRKTKETDISLTLNLDGTGESRIDSGVGFFDHMLTGFARHGLFDLTLSCIGDLQVDSHHTVEDCGIVLGTAIKEALGDKAGIRRFGSAILPMDEALVLCAIDLSGRAYFCSDLAFRDPMLGTMQTQMVKEFFYALSSAAGMNLHFQMIRGENDHHICECAFKAFAKALDQATQADPRVSGVWSTKGSL